MTSPLRSLRWAILSLFAAAVLFVSAAFGWYSASPRYTLTQMQQAAVEGDADTFASHVDFPALRASLKSELRARLMGEAANAPPSSLRALGIDMALAFVDQMVDSAISPESVGIALASAESAGSWVAPPGLQSLSLLAMPETRIARDGMDRFRVTPADGEGPALVFRRDGLNWRLSAVDLGKSTPTHPAA